MLDNKLQLKDSQTIAVIGVDIAIDLAAPRSSIEQAAAILVFVKNLAALRDVLVTIQGAARDGKTTWVAYPKANQLGTDLNREVIRAFANANELDPVRQIAIDAVWSALRLKYVG
jgi:hypothetical protein